MKLVQKMPGGDNIKAFTRIMHRTTDDDLVGEVRHGAAWGLLAVLCRCAAHFYACGCSSSSNMCAYVCLVNALLLRPIIAMSLTRAGLCVGWLLAAVPHLPVLPPAAGV
jgi:hypothetical protein